MKEGPAFWELLCLVKTGFQRGASFNRPLVLTTCSGTPAWSNCSEPVKHWHLVWPTSGLPPHLMPARQKGSEQFRTGSGSWKANGPPRGCMLMTIHKSKGKEFDGVVLVEDAHRAPFFDSGREPPPFERSRRLLRVGLTRAKHFVMIVRPRGATPLVG